MLDKITFFPATAKIENKHQRKLRPDLHGLRKGCSMSNYMMDFMFEIIACFVYPPSMAVWNVSPRR